jgi:hypothetical protein
MDRLTEVRRESRTPAYNAAEGTVVEAPVNSVPGVSVVEPDIARSLI